MGDGVCDSDLNNAHDFFDVGDCCLNHLNETKCKKKIYGPNGSNKVFEIDCPENACIKSTNYCIQELLGDGICHDQNNGPYCDYDLGDCCIRNKVLDFCCTCSCRDYENPLWLLIECPKGPGSCVYNYDEIKLLKDEKLQNG